MNSNKTNQDDLDNDKLKLVQKKLDDVNDVMRQNIQDAISRGNQLEMTVSQSETLEHSADVFNKKTTLVRNREWWRAFRMRMCIVLAILIFLLVIILPIALHFSNH